MKKILLFFALFLVCVSLVNADIGASAAIATSKINVTFPTGTILGTTIRSIVTSRDVHPVPTAELLLLATKSLSQYPELNPLPIEKLITSTLLAMQYCNPAKTSDS